jgi:succinate-acetate transporter protein
MIPVIDSEHIHGSITIPNVIVGQAFFYGGDCQMLAGIGTFVAGNTFGATVMTSFGGFWLSYAAVCINWFGIATAYRDEPDMFANGYGLFLITWFIIIFLFMV